MKKEQAEQIHKASLDLLENPGISIEHDEIYDALIANGAKPGASSGAVRFPKELVEEYIDLAPRKVWLADRNGPGHRISCCSDALVWSVPGMNILRKGTHREFTSSDMADMAWLLDQLSEIHGVFGMAMSDIPPNIRDIVGLRIMAENTQKHIRVLCFTPEGCEALCEMRDIVDTSPWFSIGFTAHGPLRWTNLALDIFMRTAGKGIPVTINGEPMAGVSGPVTLAGAAAVGNAEILAGIVINQMLEPGRPCVYNLGLAHIFDMKTSIAVTGAPENHLLADISAAMGRFYTIPSCSWVSTESMCVDSQSAIEKSAGYFSHIQSGISLIWGAGQLESELTVSPAQAVIDNEILGYVRRYLRGVEVNEDTLAVPVTRSVGISGNYLAEEHTLNHFREEFYEPLILSRSNRSNWELQGGKSLAEKAEEAAEELMQNSRPEMLTPDQRKALKNIEEKFVQCIQV